MRKRRFKSWTEAEEAEGWATRKVGFLTACLNAAMEGRVRWFDGLIYRVGVVEPTRPNGGYVIVHCTAWVDAYLLDEWFTDMSRHIDTKDREVADMVRLAGLAKQYQQKEQSKEYNRTGGGTA